MRKCSVWYVPTATFALAIVLSAISGPMGISGLTLRGPLAGTVEDCKLKCEITQKPASPIPQNDKPNQITFKFKPSWTGDCGVVFATVSYVLHAGGGGTLQPEVVKNGIEVEKTLKLPESMTVVVTIYSTMSTQSETCTFQVVVGDPPPPAECALTFEFTQKPGSIKPSDTVDHQGNKVYQIRFKFKPSWTGDCGQIWASMSSTVARGENMLKGDAIFRKISETFNNKDFDGLSTITPPTTPLNVGDVITVTVTLTSSKGGGSATKSFQVNVVP